MKISIKSIITHPLFLLGCRLFLAFIFLYAGVHKIIDPKSFVIELRNYQIFPEVLLNLIALGLPPLELLLGLALIAGPFIREAAAWLILLILGFGGGLISAMARGLDIDCGCGLPGGPTPANWYALIRDLVFLIAAVIVFLYPRKELRITIRLRPEGKDFSFRL